MSVSGDYPTFRRAGVVGVMLAISGLGLSVLVANFELPIVRNSFVYASAATKVVANGYNPLPVVADVDLSFGKPILFSFLSAPFVAIFGPNAGVKAASFVCTGLFLWVACVAFGRLNKALHIEQRLLPLELVLLFLNPLVLYQFWSGHPDSLFSALVLLAFVLVDSLVYEDGSDPRWLVPLLGIVIYAAILTKFYGLILGIAVPTYFALSLRRVLRDATRARSTIVLMLVVFGGLGAAVLLARLGLNPTLDFAVGEESGSGGGYSDYVEGVTEPSLEFPLAGTVSLVITFVLCFNFAVVFLLRKDSWRWPVATASFAALLFLGLLPFDATTRNIRYFIPLLPFVVAGLAKGIQETKGRLIKRAAVVLYLLVATSLTLIYNLEPVYVRLSPDSWIGSKMGRVGALDNLRMSQHLWLRRLIERINGAVPQSGVLYWVSSYYRSSTWGMIERMGLREDIQVRYAHRFDEVPVTGETVYVSGLGRGGGLSRLAGRFSVTPLRGVARLSPVHVSLEVEDFLAPGESVRLRAQASSDANAGPLEIEFLVGDRPIARIGEPPYEIGWRPGKSGRFEITAKATDGRGNDALSLPWVVYAGVPAFERSVAQPKDDAEEAEDGLVDLYSSDLELAEDSGRQLVGLRFANIAIPKGSQVSKAYLQFTVDEPSSGTTKLSIHAQRSADAATFEEADGNLSSRPTTTASVSWSPGAWHEVGESSPVQRSPDLSALVEEVMALAEWQENGALVFLISGSGRRVAESQDGGSLLRAAPRLYIELSQSTPP